MDGVLGLGPWPGDALNETDSPFYMLPGDREPPDRRYCSAGLPLRQAAIAGSSKRPRGSR
jgi:hypothetical protein